MSDEYNPWTGTGGMFVLPGEGAGERAETGLTVFSDVGGVDPISGTDTGVTPGAPGAGWGTPGSFGTFLAELEKGNIGGILSGLLGGGYGPGASLAAYGILGGLLSKMGGGGGSQPSTGYQGGIPKYTIERAQTPLSQQRPENYRPGQGGITYFTPIKYAEQKPVTATANPSTQTGSAVKTEEQNAVSAAHGGYMPGGIAMLAKGGNTSRYLRGPGDGVSDSIPAKFDHSGQPARLADGEFVIDARTVSEIGNGSSEAGARKLYAMMDRVHKARKKAVRGKPSGADKFLPK